MTFTTTLIHPELDDLRISIQLPKYSQEFDDVMSALSEYLYEKYSLTFDQLYLEECDSHVIDTSYSNCASIDEYVNEVVPN
jgi:hypothetical protein